MNDKNFNGKIRKLSCTLLLNDPNDYDGGQFEFDYRNTNQSNKKQVNELNQIGSILIFPSFVWHKVFPITKGVRYSLVAWYLGLPFR